MKGAVKEAASGPAVQKRHNESKLLSPSRWKTEGGKQQWSQIRCFLQIARSQEDHFQTQTGILSAGGSEVDVHPLWPPASRSWRFLLHLLLHSFGRSFWVYQTNTSFVDPHDETSWTPLNCGYEKFIGILETWKRIVVTFLLVWPPHLNPVVPCWSSK